MIGNDLQVHEFSVDTSAWTQMRFSFSEVRGPRTNLNIILYSISYTVFPADLRSVKNNSMVHFRYYVNHCYLYPHHLSNISLS